MAPFLILSLLIGVPAAEIYTFTLVADHIGGLATVGLVLLSAVLGMGLIRWQGLTMVEQARASMARGEPPVGSLLNGVAIFAAGLLFMLPGFLSDGLALLLLLPPVRWLLMAAAVRVLGHRVAGNSSAAGAAFFDQPHNPFESADFRPGFQGGVDIDGEYRDVSPSASASEPQTIQILPPHPTGAAKPPEER